MVLRKLANVPFSQLANFAYAFFGTVFKVFIYFFLGRLAFSFYSTLVLPFCSSTLAKPRVATTASAAAHGLWYIY